MIRQCASARTFVVEQGDVVGEWQDIIEKDLNKKYCWWGKISECAAARTAVVVQDF